MSLMQLILSYEAMKTGLTAASKKFRIGTVEGDIHDIGSIVAATLTAEGIDVVDIGVYIPESLR